MSLLVLPPEGVFLPIFTLIVGPTSKALMRYFGSWLSRPKFPIVLPLMASAGILIPPTPHFGRLWEAAVKSVKYHLFRVVPSNFFVL